MQAAGDFVAAAAELAAGMQHRHHRFERGAAGLGVLVHRDAAPAVGDDHPAVRLQGDVDAVAVAGHPLVDAVVDDLVDEVVQAAVVGAADVHAGAAAHGLQPLQHLDVGGVIRAVHGARAGKLINHALALVPTRFRLPPATGSAAADPLHQYRREQDRCRTVAAGA